MYYLIRRWITCNEVVYKVQRIKIIMKEKRDCRKKNGTIVLQKKRPKKKQQEEIDVLSK